MNFENNEIAENADQRCCRNALIFLLIGNFHFLDCVLIFLKHPVPQNHSSSQGGGDTGLDALTMRVDWESRPQCSQCHRYQGFFPWGVERPESEADNSPPSSAKSRMPGAIPPLPITPSWRGAQLKHRDKFTLPHPYQVIQVTIQKSVTVLRVRWNVSSKNTWWWL